MENRERWLEDRKKGIGGSDAPAICGVSPWRSPYQVYTEKRGEAVDTPDSGPMFWGRTLEPVIRQRYADVTGLEVQVPNKILVCRDHPWMLASLDGIAGGDRVLEVKTSRTADGWGEPETDEVPEAYLVQVQHYLRVTELTRADLAVLIGGNDFRIYTVPADRELQDMIVDQEAEFWDRVQRGDPPDARSLADVRARFGAASREQRVQATPEVLRALEELRRLKVLTKGEDALKAVILGLLADADTLVDGDKVLATWRAGKPAKRFDLDAFKTEHPDLHAQFVRDSNPSRRFLLK